jgi:hypothetical protein
MDSNHRAFYGTRFTAARNRPLCQAGGEGDGSRTRYSSAHNRAHRRSAHPQSIRQDSNLREAVCGTAALPLSY